MVIITKMEYRYLIIQLKLKNKIKRIFGTMKHLMILLC